MCSNATNWTDLRQTLNNRQGCSAVLFVYFIDVAVCLPMVWATRRPWIVSMPHVQVSGGLSYGFALGLAKESVCSFWIATVL
jgi:hypothetical protein